MVSDSPHQNAEDLSNALEQLSVAEEELRAQNAALLAANELVDEERQHYIDLFETLPDAYVVTDGVGVIQEANPATEALLHLELRRLVGKPLTVFAGERDKRRLRTMMVEAADGARPADFDLRLRPRGRADKPVAIRMSRISSEPVRIGWLIRDLSDRADVSRFAQRMEDEHAARLDAERATRRFRFLAEIGRHLTGATDQAEICHGVVNAIVKFTAEHCAIYLIESGQLQMIASADRQTARRELVRAMKQHYRMDITDVDGAIWQTVLTGEPQTVPPLEQRVSDMRWKSLFNEIRDHGPRAAVVLPLQRRDQCFGAILIMGGLPTAGIGVEEVGVLLEVATRMSLTLDNARLLEKLRLVNREKSEFLAVLSHELRTPLSAVIGYAELLLSGIPAALPDSARQQVDRIRNSAWHQLTIVEQLLSHARPGVNEEVIMRRPVELVAEVSQAVELVTHAAAGKGLAIDLDVPTAFSLRTDPGRLRQILINLLWNAVKFTDHGRIRVGVRGSDDNIFITVSDTGAGIAADSLNRVFDPYWQAEKGGSGIGLGLSVSRKLAHLLGGDLTAESELGKGSTFTLRLHTE